MFICADREPRGKAIACEVSQDHGWGFCHQRPLLWKTSSAGAKTILCLFIYFAIYWFNLKPDNKQAQAAGEGEQGDQMLRAGGRPHPALPPGETLPSYCNASSSSKGSFLEAVMPSSIFLKPKDHLRNCLHRRLIGAAGALTLSQLSPCKVLEPPAAPHRLPFHQVDAAFRNLLPYSLLCNLIINGSCDWTKAWTNPWGSTPQGIFSKYYWLIMRLKISKSGTSAQPKSRQSG